MQLQNYTQVPIFTNAFEKVQTPNYQDMIAHSHNKIKPASAVAGPNREAAQFNPYQNNQGTVIGIAGKDFCIAATDTRISQGYNILSRTHSKTTRLTDKCCITSSGMVADVEELHRVLEIKLRQFRMANRKRDPPMESIANLLGNTLYSRRFMPYYTFNLLCGIDKNGEGCVYGYDAIGSYGRETYGIQGSGNNLGMPVLDNQLIGHNYLDKQLEKDPKAAKETALDILNSIAERDIYTGDGVEIVTVDKDGVHFERHGLRRD